MVLAIQFLILSLYRVSMKDTLYPLFLIKPPLDAPELMISGEDLIELETVINDVSFIIL